MTAEILDRLSAFDACTISDALDTLGLDGAVDGIRPVWEGARTVGAVVTMKVVAAPGERAPRHLGAAAIEMAGDGHVVVIEQQRDPELVSATWGGLLARAATLRGVAGVVIDGACRDVDEIRELGLGVWSRDVVPYTARRRYIESSVGEPITVGGVRIEMGDYVVADGSGVVFIRGEYLSRVLDLADRIAAKERLMAADLAAGVSPSVVLGKNYEELLDE